MNTLPRVTVIIAARNAAATIGKCLVALRGQEGVDFEIIVVDDESADDTVTIAKSFDGVRVVELEWVGPSQARNIGMSHARGEIVAFIDADCVVQSGWLSELTRCFDDPSVAGAGGDQVSPDDELPMGRGIQEFFKTIGFMTDYIKPEESGSAIRETRHNPSCNSAYRKDLFQKVGGFSQGQFPGEDLELDLKLAWFGHKLVYNPAAVVGHYRPKSLRALASMMRRYGAGEKRLVQKYGVLRRLDYQPLIFLLSLIALWSCTAHYPASRPFLSMLCLAPFGWFLWKTGSFSKSVRFTLFLTVVIINWNWGFIRGGGKPMGRTGL
jgi:succinoglycan biosynthesis protein ExoA